MTGPAHARPLEGRRFIITGANIGLGYATARGLAADGAELILACRNEARARAAMDGLARDYPQTTAHLLPLDLASLASVRAFAASARERFDRVDGLCNNAGIMAVPKMTTEDGFERQLGTNHLGHFALTGLLLPLLLAAPDPRVVAVSSLAHRAGAIDLDDLGYERGYSRWGAYARSKLANLLFALELDRRCKSAGVSLKSVAAHPGYSATGLISPRRDDGGPTWLSALGRLGNSLVAQSASFGALPSLEGFRRTDLQGGEYFGPDGPGEFAGQPVRVRPSRRARDPDLARGLWEASVRLTGVSFEALS